MTEYVKYKRVVTLKSMNKKIAKLIKRFDATNVTTMEDMEEIVIESFKSGIQYSVEQMEKALKK